MKHLRQICLGVFLLLALCIPVFADGQMGLPYDGPQESPGVAGPQESPGVTGEISTPGFTGDMLLSLVDGIIQTGAALP